MTKILLIGLAWTWLTPARASAPGEMQYQGELSSSHSGFTGFKSATFSVWDSDSGGTQLYTETQNAVAVTNGGYSARIGSVTPIPAAVFQGGPARYLQIVIPGEPAAPRLKLASAPYALSVAGIDISTRGASVAGRLGVLNSSPQALLHLGTWSTIDDDGTTGTLARNAYFNPAHGQWETMTNNGSVRMQFASDGTLTLQTASATVPGSPINWAGLLVLNRFNRFGIGEPNPQHLIHLAGGAYSDGTTWNPASSRKLKTDIADLSSTEALGTLKALRPVTYRYKAKPSEKRAGFIAEEVPELISVKARDSFGVADVAAVLTKVLQEQEALVREQALEIARLKKALKKAGIE